MAVVAIILLWKLVDVVTAILAPRFIRYLGFFSYPETMDKYGLPKFLQSLSNFDGIMYIRIALQGYSPTEEAYFPLYPILIRYLTPQVANNPIIAGITISNLGLLIALIIFWLLIRKIGIEKGTSIWIVAFLFSYPTSYYFGVMYTESIFLVLFLSSLYCLYSRRYIIGFVFGYLTGLTRITGVLISIPIAIQFIEQIKLRRLFDLGALRKHLGLLMFMISPIAGLASYSWYLGAWRGDALAFFHAQEHFGANRSTRIILLPQVIYRYIKMFLTADKSFQYYVAILELTFLLFALGILIYDLRKILTRGRPFDSFRLGVSLFSFANILLPTLTGTLTAIPRYTLLSLSIFFVLAEIRQTWIKLVIIFIFLIAHVVMFAHFIQGYYLT